MMSFTLVPGKHILRVNHNHITYKTVSITLPHPNILSEFESISPSQMTAYIRIAPQSDTLPMDLRWGMH